MTEVVKECRTCHETKSLSEFGKNCDAKDGRKYSCKKCESQRTREWQKRNPEKAKALLHRTKIKRLYNISVEEYDKLMAKGCSICGSHEKLHIDHDHSNGKVRAALCHYCNVGLGVFKDDPEKLKRAIEYLDEHQEEEE